MREVVRSKLWPYQPSGARAGADPGIFDRGGPNLDSEKHYINFFQISGKTEWLSIKKQVNQLSNNRRSCRWENFRLKQVVKKKLVREGGGGGSGPVRSTAGIGR